MKSEISGFNSEPAVAQTTRQDFFFDDPNSFPEEYKQRPNVEK